MSSRLNDSRWLKVHLPLNGHSKDVSGNGNDGTVTSGILWRTNAFNKSCVRNDTSINGSQYIVLSNNASVVDTSGSFSIGFWAKQDDTTNANRNYVSKRLTYNANNIEIGSFSDYFTFKIHSGSDNNTINTIGGSIKSQIPNFVVATYDSNTKLMSIWHNGQLKTTRTRTEAILTNNVDWHITNRATSYNEPILGEMWDFRLYNIALTGDEILELYRRGIPNIAKTEQPYDTLPDLTDTSLKGAWLNKETRGTALDYSNEGTDGTIIGTPKIGKGLVINNDGYFKATSLPLVTGEKYQTMCCKYKHNGSVSSTPVLVGNASSFALRLSGNNLKFYTATNGTPSYTQTSSYALTAGKWYHIIASTDDVSLYLYINGVLVKSATLNGTITGSTKSFYVNYRDGSQTDLNGEVRDVEIYNEAKSADWVAQKYAESVPDDSLVLHTLVPGHGAKDLSRYGNDGTVTGAIVGNGGVFDGTGNVIITHNDIFNFASTGFTINVWCKHTNAARETIIGKLSGSAQDGWNLRFESNNTVFFSYREGSGTEYAVWPTNNTGLNKFNHLCVTVDVINLSATIYINGEAALTSDLVHTTAFTNPQNLNIGSYGDVQNYFNGTIKDVKIFNEAKDSAWVSAEYNRQRKFM